MPSQITFFPVGNGDMGLIRLNDTDKTSILIDINIRQNSEDDDTQCDAADELRKRLKQDKDGRPYVDVFVLTHPDQDHCRGLQEHFHLDSIENYDDEPEEGKDKKIIIRELWSSPMIFRRASRNNKLCEDAKAFNKEAHRRIKLFKEKGLGEEGNRILVIGEDENGKTDVLQDILVKIDEEFKTINNKTNDLVYVSVLAPLPPQDEEEKEQQLSSNGSSIILRFSIKSNKNDSEAACRFLVGGDADVFIWEKLWEKHKDNPETLGYDVLLTPHHCSWHSLSYDSWDTAPNPQVSHDARSALAQARSGATLIASSNPIKDDENDPPCWGAKLEYKKIAKEAGISATFICAGEHPDENSPEPYEIEIHSEGHQRPAIKAIGSASIIYGSTKEPLFHG